MKFHVITAFPELIHGPLQAGVVGQALKRDIFALETYDPREVATDVHRSIDDRPFGGGDGMVMLPDILERVFLKANFPASAKKIFLSPQGQRFDEAKARELAQEKDVVLLCARYSGVDERFLREFVHEELSIGDYVLSGGELAASVVIDCVVRKLPGVLGDEISAQKDSFSQGLLEEPLFTRPRKWKTWEVPQALLSGNHQKIAQWRSQVAYLVTLKKRPDLFHQLNLSRAEISELKKFLAAMSIEEKDVMGLSALVFPESNHE